ncbi:MAG: hypothetical protein OQK32_00495 [Gammaproteobacteria bacterium]|nr:hypothetical protein [Gammaproteobacteria bacterium]MCW8924095.1 hypothetical protein [Gammaproteobacteria bacterium]
MIDKCIYPECNCPFDMGADGKCLRGLERQNKASAVEEHKPKDTIYSDRLYEWDSDKYNTLCEKHFGDRGQWWNTREAEKIEAFLSDYLGRPVTLINIEKQENKATGFPVWRFDIEG